MKFSVIVPAYNAERTLPSLLGSILEQTCNAFELIVVDDCSTDNTPSVVQDYRCTLIGSEKNHGPAYCRNRGAQEARGDILVFTDSDCTVGRNWLANIHIRFSQNHMEAVMGRLILKPSTFLGDSISALGFPAGGCIGFDKIWKVDQNGYTDSLSSCNCAIKKDIFWEVGGFDETFPYPGGEDSLLAYHLRSLNYRIKYCPDVLVYHQARDSLSDFLKWQFQRGMSSFIFSKKVSNKKDFVSLRVWSTGNIIRCYFTDKKFPLVLFLLSAGSFMQFAGFLTARYKGLHESIDY